MRLLAAMLFMSLATPALADDARPADHAPSTTRIKTPLRVIRIMPESHQALLFDRNRGTYVLAEVGKSFDRYTVAEIDDDEVTLDADGTTIVLVDHDMQLVLSLCDEIHVLVFGRLVASGPPEVVQANPEVAAAYLGETHAAQPTGAA